MSPSEVLGNVREEVKRRMGSPFAGSYVIAWCLLNYEVLIVIFGEGGYADKIGYISRTLYLGVSPLQAFGLPALIALIPVFVVPLSNLGTDLLGKTIDVLRERWTESISTGRWISDAALRKVARNRAFQVEHMQAHAKESLLLYAAAAFRITQFEPRGRAGYVKLDRIDQFTHGLPREVVSWVTTVGLPAETYNVMKHLQHEGRRLEQDLLANAMSVESRAHGKETLGLLLGAKVLDLVWDASASMPSYELSDVGVHLLEVIDELYGGQFV